jgi:hypothetical protein
MDTPEPEKKQEVAAEQPKVETPEPELKTTDIVSKPKKIPNPTGKGGFQERPQDIKKGGAWSPENTQSYCIRKFMNMTEKEFKEWGAKNPQDKRTVAQVLAYERVTQARLELADYKEIVERVEGKAPQTMRIETESDMEKTNVATLLLEVIAKYEENEKDNKGSNKEDSEKLLPKKQ